MTKLNYFLPFVFALLSLGVIEWYIGAPRMVYFALLIVIIFNLATAFILGKKERSDWWKFALLPTLANLIVIGYSIILTNHVMLQVLAILLTIFNYIYWRYVFYYLHRQSQYTSFSLENLSFYINFILVFLFGSLIYGLRSLLSLNILALGIAVLIILCLIVLQVFWISKLNWKENKIYIIIGVLALMELFFMLSFLPLDHNLLGFLWATNYYVVISMISDKLKDRLTKQKIKYILVLTFVCWLILFLSARWI
ncbi:MAG: hypothetical protein V1865_03220 [bacterium]